MKKLMVAVVLTLITLFNFQVEAARRSASHKHKKHHTTHVKKRVHNRKKTKAIRHKRRKKSSCVKFARGNSRTVHQAVLTHSAAYDVPAEIVFAILYYETGYRGEDHKSYNGARTSSCGAVGPMQVMPRYAKRFAGRSVSRSELRSNYNLNIKVGVKMLAYQYKLYRSWAKVLGAYSTGRPVANWYSRKVLRKADQLQEQFLIAGTNC